ncbi:hypothetical protein M0R45_006717 [Rubus argutus]|uniref:hAT-like transposase RNase-H fold domain-containing protein n=1 Tax=Rubus argutus TaxID=59490 RepID=A0AAW1YRX4_RUBAR
MTNPDGSKMAKARAKCSHCTQTYAVDSKSNGDYKHENTPLVSMQKESSLHSIQKAKFSGTKVVTANQPLLWMCTIVGELEKCIKSDDPLLASIGTSMKIKFDKYWNKLEDMNKILIIAVVLDPRYKLLYLEYFFPKLQKDQNLVELMVSEMKSMFLKLFKEYAAADPEAFQASMDATLPKPANVTADQCDEDSHAENLQGFMKLRQEKDVVEIKHEKLVSLMLLRLKSEMKW